MYSYETNGRGNTSATDAKLLERKSQFINLPAVTPEDNGKVLGVDSGKWQPVDGADPVIDNAKETGGVGWTDEDEIIHKIDEKYLPASGGGGMLVVHFNGDVLDKTNAEIYEAKSNGMDVVVDGGTEAGILRALCITENQAIFNTYYLNHGAEGMEVIFNILTVDNNVLSVDSGSVALS